MAYSAVKSALAAIGLRLALGMLKRLLGGAIFRKGIITSLLDELFKEWNPFKWGALVGGVASFPLLDALLVTKDHDRRKLTNRLASSTCAGIAAALPGMLVMQPTTLIEIALMGFWRVAHCLGSLAIGFSQQLPPSVVAQAPWLGIAQRILSFRYFDVVAIGLANAQLMYAFGFCPDTHSTSYRRFVMKWAGTDEVALDAVGSFHRGQRILPAAIARCESLGVAPPAGPKDVDCLCRMLHPWTDSCLRYQLWKFPRDTSNFFLRLYLPLKVVTTLVYQPGKALRSPVEFATESLRSTLFSSLFLACQGGLPLSSVCMLTRSGTTGGWKMWLLMSVLSMLPPFFEAPSRRLELTFFSLGHALRSWYLMLFQRGYVPRPTGRLVRFFYLAVMTLLLVCYRHFGRFLQKNTRSMIDTVTRERSKTKKE